MKRRGSLADFLGKNQQHLFRWCLGMEKLRTNPCFLSSEMPVLPFPEIVTEVGDVILFWQERGMILSHSHTVD